MRGRPPAESLRARMSASDAVKAIVGLRPSFSAQVRWGEPGAPVASLRRTYDIDPCGTLQAPSVSTERSRGNPYPGSKTRPRLETYLKYRNHIPILHAP